MRERRTTVRGKHEAEEEEDAGEEEEKEDKEDEETRRTSLATLEPLLLPPPPPPSSISSASSPPTPPSLGSTPQGAGLSLRGVSVSETGLRRDAPLCRTEGGFGGQRRG